MSQQTVEENTVEIDSNSQDQLPLRSKLNIAANCFDVDSKNEKNSQIILVTGMHRGGTSALAGLLQASGFEFGDHLLPAKPGVNEKGFFEDKRIMEINERVFASLGREWWSFDEIEQQVWQNESILALQQQAKKLLEQQTSRIQRLIIKDPRFCLLLPFWTPVFASLSLEVKIIISVRHSQEVAMSLWQRDQFDIDVGCLLWLQHYLAIEAHSRQYQRVFISYQSLLNEDPVECNKLADFVGKKNLNIDFIDKQLQHYKVINNPEDRLAAELYTALLQQPTGSDEKQENDQIARVDDIRQRFEGQQQRFQGSLKNQRIRIAGLLESYDSAEKILHSQKDQFENQQFGFDQAMQQLECQQSGFDQAMQQLECQRFGFDQAMQQLLAANKKVQYQAIENLRLKQIIAKTTAAALPPAVPLSRNLGVSEGQPKMRYEARIDLAALNNAHTKVIRKVMTLTKELPILEVGCSSAYLGGYLQQEGYQVWGIELDADAAAAARNRIEYVFEGSVEDFFAVVKDVKFGAVIFGDVLEHLVDADVVIQQAVGLLAESGLIIASIPNVAHMSVRMMLLAGRWDYQQTGILDNTHLRFYTRDSIVQLMDNNDLKITDFESVVQSWREIQAGVNTTLFDQVESLVGDSDGDVFQFVVSAAPMLQPEKVNAAFKVRCRRKILCLLPLPDSSLANIRIIEPLKKNSENFGSDIRYCAVFTPTPEDIKWCDVVVLQRESNDYVLGLMSNLRLLGKKIIFDIDDLLLDVPEYLTVHDHCVRMKPYLESALRLADAVTVSTSPLFDEIQTYNSNTWLVPNGAFNAFPPIVHHETYDNQINLIVASSDSVRVDFIQNALTQLIAKYADRIKLIGIGPPGKFLYDQGLPVEVHPVMSHDQFRAFLVSNANTIAWVPLDDSKFNRCKSAVKYFDYCLAGIPVLCSNMVPYSEVVSNGETGFLCADETDQWINYSSALIESVDLRQTIATRARRRTLQKHGIERTASCWQLAIDSLPLFEPLPELQHVDDKTIEMLEVRSPVNFVRGIFNRILKPSAYVGAVRVYRLYGLRGLWNYSTSLAGGKVAPGDSEKCT
ncbi:MAG: methyltransferase domain-containing protein [Pseudomonadales bacterium]|nr:methyltransferase domain-containing protein [Pseudomonadales bacterium]